MRAKPIHKLSWAHGAGRLTSTVYEGGEVRNHVGGPSTPSQKRPAIPKKTPAKVRDAIAASIQKAIDPEDKNPPHRGYEGGTVEPGLVIYKTDGHRAIIEPGPEIPGKKRFTSQHRYFRRHRTGEWLVGPEYGERLLEVATCADERSGLVMHQVRSATEMVVSASHADGVESLASVPINLQAGTVVLGDFPWEPFGLNWKYVRPVLGAWPLRMSFTSHEDPFGLSIDGADWHFIVMPMRASSATDMDALMGRFGLTEYEEAA